jgi:hypothetical protein
MTDFNPPVDGSTATLHDAILQQRMSHVTVTSSVNTAKGHTAGPAAVQPMVVQRGFNPVHQMECTVMLAQLHHAVHGHARASSKITAVRALMPSKSQTTAP